MRSRIARNPLPALAAALGFAALYALLASAEPGRALSAFFLGPFSSPYAYLALLAAATPLLLSAFGAAVAFRAGLFNLGGEGQVAVGGLAAALVLAFAANGAAGGGGAGAAWAAGGGFHPLAALGLAFLAAACAGAFLAGLSALAERATGAEVLLTSFLLSQTALVVVDWAVAGPLRDPSSNLLAMPPIAAAFRLPRLAPPAPLDAGLFLVLALALCMTWLLKWTKAGYELALRGRSPDFARAQGLDANLDLWPLLLSGALHGLAGALLVAGSAGRAVKGMSGGLGWNGISVALVAATEPLALAPAALFFAWLDAGALRASILADLSPDASAVMKALVLLLVTARPALGLGRRGGGEAAAGRGGGPDGAARSAKPLAEPDGAEGRR